MLWGQRARDGQWMTAVRPVALAALLAVGMTLGMAVVPGLRGSQPSVCACGLGNTVTMIANNAPALAYAPPNAATDAPAGIFALDYIANQPITLHEDLSRLPNAPDPASIKWRWNFGDGSPEVNTSQTTHTFTTPGTYTIAVYVYEPLSNDWGLFDNAIIHIDAQPITSPPVARAQALTPAVIGVGDKITFDGAGSHPVVGSGLKYEWNFGDNSVGSGSHVTHQFNQAGRGFVTLAVTDDRGAKAIAQVNVVIIEPSQPVNVTAAPTSAPIGSTINFDASKTQPPADNPVTVAWDFGDGSPLATTSTPTVSHIYKEPGNYTVTVGVYGQLGDGGVTALHVRALPAVASAGAHNGSGGNTLALAIGGGVGALALIAGGVFFWMRQRKRAALIRDRQMRQELARARRVNGANSGRGASGPRRRDPAAVTPGGRGASRGLDGEMSHGSRGVRYDEGGARASRDPRETRPTGRYDGSDDGRSGPPPYRR